MANALVKASLPSSNSSARLYIFHYDARWSIGEMATVYARRTGRGHRYIQAQFGALTDCQQALCRGEGQPLA